jgi:hypothetical protein
VSVPAIVQYWDDMVRVAGSLSTNKVRAYDLIKMMTAGGRLTGLGNAFAAYGRIFKTLHLLQIIHVESYRRMIGAQLNTGESRHQLARRVFFGNLGQLRQSYERGMENQLGALGLGLNSTAPNWRKDACGTCASPTPSRTSRRNRAFGERRRHSGPGRGTGWARIHRAVPLRRMARPARTAAPDPCRAC